MTMSCFGANIPVTVAGVWAFVTTVTTGIFYWKKDRVERSVSRAEKLNQILQKLEADDVETSFYMFIEHEASFFVNGSFVNETVERSIDRMLNWFSYMCYLRRKRIITRSEFEGFAYWITRSLSNDQILDYLECLYVNYDLKVVERPFCEFVRYGRWIGIDRIDVLWSKYMEKMPWWQRVLDNVAHKKSGIWHWFNSLRCEHRVAHCAGQGDVEKADLKSFRIYLNDNFSVQSARSIYSCAISVRGLLEKPLSELASTEGRLNRCRDDLTRIAQGRWASLANYRHALKTYLKYSQTVHPNH